MIINQIKTIMLLGFLAGILVISGRLIGGSESLVPAIMMATSLSVFSYFFSSNIVLAMHKAQPMSEHDSPEIHEIVQELSHKMSLPMPKIYRIPSPIANAFATGRNPSNAVIGITDGIREILDSNEMRGVLAHELAHVQHRDTLLMTVATTLAAAIGYLGNMARYLSYGYRSRDENNRNRPGVLAQLIIMFVLPFAATLVRLSVSRNREYMADEEGAYASRDPLALASALEKMEEYKKVKHFQPYDILRATSEPLFIINPLWGKGSFSSLFSTHPPVEERIKRLRNLYERMFKD